MSGESTYHDELQAVEDSKFWNTKTDEEIKAVHTIKDSLQGEFEALKTIDRIQADLMSLNDDGEQAGWWLPDEFFCNGEPPFQDTFLAMKDEIARSIGAHIIKMDSLDILEGR